MSMMFLAAIVGIIGLVCASTLEWVKSWPEGPRLRKQPLTWGTETFSDEELTRWTITAVSSGTCVVADEEGGPILISGAATTDESGSNIQRDTTMVKIEGDIKQVRQMFSFRLSDVAQSDFFGGLTIVDTSIIASAPNDQIGVRMAEGSANLTGFVRRDGADVGTVALGALVNATEVCIAVLVTSAFTAFYRDGIEIGKVETVTSPLTEEYMTPSFAFNSGDNIGTKTCRIYFEGGQLLK